MNSDVHPAIAALVLFVSAMALALWMWGSGVAASYGGPSELNKSRDGHIFVQIQNYLVEHDSSGAYLKTHDLGKLDIDVFLGGFAFFSNGDVLLRRGPDQRSILDNIRAYKRETNQNSIIPEGPDSGLFRCDLDTDVCERFGEQGVDFKAAHGIFVDWESDDVYISDTTRHLLRKYTSDGIEAAAPGGGFKFPNQLMLHGGHLLVADTNHHIIRRVESKSSGFAEFIDARDVVPGAATLVGQTWPSHFARIGEQWWVNNMRTGMNLGGLYIFDDEWQYVRSVELPPGADPISILAVGDSVWVSDWNNDKVRRFSTAGEPLADLESTGLETILASSRKSRLNYTILSYSGVPVVVLMFVVLIVRARMRGPTEARNRDMERPETADATQEALHLEPDEKVRKRANRALSIVGTLFLLAIAGLLFNLSLLAKPEAFRVLVYPFAGIFVAGILIAWINRANLRTSVSIDGDRVTLRDHTGRESHSSVRQIRYDDNAIATRDVVVLLGMPNAPIYNREDIQNRLLPRLSEAQRVGPLAMLKIQIAMRHPQGILMVLLALGILAYGVVKLIT